MLQETMTRSEQIGEEYQLTLNALETVYDRIYSLREAGAGLVLDELSDQLHVLVQMQSTCSLDGYDPRFLATWEVVVQAMASLNNELQHEPRLKEAYQAATEAMRKWEEIVAEVPYEAYLRLQDQEFAEARERNREVQEGDSVVLLKNIWLFGEIGSGSPDVPFGSLHQVVRRGTVEGDTRDPQDYVTLSLIGYEMSFPWTIVMPLERWKEMMRDEAKKEE